MGGVNIGKCDLRLFLRAGDTVNFQLHDMSSAEKRKLKKQLGKNDVSQTHMATLVYFASEKRPKNATQTPDICPELKDFLSGMSIFQKNEKWFHEIESCKIILLSLFHEKQINLTFF